MTIQRRTRHNFEVHREISWTQEMLKQAPALKNLMDMSKFSVDQDFSDWGFRTGWGKLWVGK